MLNRRLFISLLVCYSLLAGGCASLRSFPSAQQKLTYPDLVQRMIDLERLAVLPTPGETTHQVSSYDRKSKFENGKYVAWDANSDGTGFIREENGKEVLAEINGPGCIWRIWSAAPAGGHIRIYLDGAETPSIDLPFAEYFSGKSEPFTYPALVYRTPSGEFQGGSNNYVPIPFQKSCRIVADKGWGWYHEFNYTLFPAGTQVPTFKRDLAPEDKAALARANEFLSKKIGTDPAGTRPEQQIIEKHVTVPVGKTATIADISGGGAITSLKIRMPALRGMKRSEQENVLRELVLRISWDGEKNPSVWSPLGDFFGSAPGVNPYKSLPMGMGEDEFYSYWYMPFAKGAKIEIVNDGFTDRIVEATIVRAPLSQPARSYARFHAKWHRDIMPPAERERAIDWTVVKTQGRGRLCGILLNVWNPRALWWGEGDEKFFVDGEKFPSTIGTGSEDYFGYAWGQPFFFNYPFHCLTLVDPSNRNHTSGVRWHIPDSVPFQQSFEGSIEKYQNNDVPVQYSAVTYWYLSADGEDPFGEIPLNERVNYYNVPKVYKVSGALEAEDLPVLEKTNGFYHFHDLSFWGKDKFSGDAGLAWTRGKEGDVFTLGFPVETEAEYDVRVVTVNAGDHGSMQMHLDGKKVGPAIDSYNNGWVVPSPEISLGKHRLSPGQHRLGIEITGKNPQAKGLRIEVDYLKLVKVK